MPKRKPDPIASNGDPRPYDGPIEDIHGRRPYNGYLWPTESWNVASGDFAIHRNANGNCWRFGIVALWDGTFAVDGHLWMIEQDNRRYGWGSDKDKPRRPNIYPTRLAAIRSSAASILRQVRNAVRYERTNPYKWGIDAWCCATPDDIIQWARSIVSYEEWAASRGETANDPPP